MKAIRFRQHGGPEVLKYEDAPDPKIAPDEVLVKIKACALNHLDLWLRKGVRSWQLRLPHIVGSDISGEVAEVGSLVSSSKVGDRVLLNPGLCCGQCEACSKGLDSACRGYTLFGVMVDGGYAEYVKAPQTNVIPIPGDLSFDEAAAVPLVFTTAWHMLFKRAQLKPGEDVLVIGAGSGVGSAAIQIAKLAGARERGQLHCRHHARESAGRAFSPGAWAPAFRFTAELPVARRELLLRTRPLPARGNHNLAREPLVKGGDVVAARPEMKFSHQRLVRTLRHARNAPFQPPIALGARHTDLHAVAVHR